MKQLSDREMRSSVIYGIEASIRKGLAAGEHFRGGMSLS